MHINNTFNNLSFGRVIRLETSSDWNSEKVPGKVNTNVRAVLDTITTELPRENAQEASKDKAKKEERDLPKNMGEALRGLIIDYRAETGIQARKYGNTTLIFTGDDVIKLKQKEEQNQKELNAFEKEIKELSKKDNLEGFKQDLVNSEMLQIVAKEAMKKNQGDEILDMAENGKDGKADTTLKVRLNSVYDIEKVEYTSTGSKDDTIPAMKKTYRAEDFTKDDTED